MARDAPGGLCAEQGTSGMMVTSQSVVVTYPPHVMGASSKDMDLPPQGVPEVPAQLHPVLQEQPWG